MGLPLIQMLTLNAIEALKTILLEQTSLDCDHREAIVSAFANEVEMHIDPTITYITWNRSLPPTPDDHIPIGADLPEHTGISAAELVFSHMLACLGITLAATTILTPDRREDLVIHWLESLTAECRTSATELEHFTKTLEANIASR